MGLSHFTNLQTIHPLNCSDCENFKNNDPMYRNVKTISDEKYEKLEKEIKELKIEIETMKKLQQK